MRSRPSAASIWPTSSTCRSATRTATPTSTSPCTTPGRGTCTGPPASSPGSGWSPSRTSTSRSSSARKASDGLQRGTGLPGTRRPSTWGGPASRTEAWPKPGDGRRTLEDDVHFACRRVVDTFTLKQLGDRDDLPTTGPQATGGGGFTGAGVGGRGAVPLEHRAGLPASDAHEVGLGAALGEPLVREGVPELVRM